MAIAYNVRRRKQFPTAAEISSRDHLARLARRPQPLDALHTTRGGEAFALVTSMTWSETPRGAPLPLKATYGDDGRFPMAASLEKRLSRDEPRPPREYLTVPEVATLLDVSAPTVTKAMSDAGLEMYRPGGMYGKRRIRLSTIERYLRLAHYSEGEIAEMLAKAKATAAE